MQEHYFGTRAGEALQEIEIEVSISGKPVRLVSARGIFSQDAVDKGSAVLVKFLQSERGKHYYDAAQSGNVLDIGCGWGLFTLEAAAANSAAQVYGVDVNTHAVTLTRQNATLLQLGNAHAYIPEELPRLEYDLILSNPPIRIGKEKTMALLERYLAQLKAGKSALFVIQKNLGADSIASLLAAKYRVQKLASSKGFRILEVSRG